MKQMNTALLTKEHLSNEVRRFIHAKGFSLASHTGLAFDEMEDYTTTSVGILYLDPESKPTSYCWGLLKRKARRSFLGVVWLADDARGADVHHWQLEVHGQKYFHIAQGLAREMSAMFGVNVSVHLLSAQSVQEISVSDYCAN